MDKASSTEPWEYLSLSNNQLIIFLIHWIIDAFVNIKWILFADETFKSIQPQHWLDTKSNIDFFSFLVQAENQNILPRKVEIFCLSSTKMQSKRVFYFVYFAIMIISNCCLLLITIVAHGINISICVLVVGHKIASKISLILLNMCILFFVCITCTYRNTHTLSLYLPRSDLMSTIL